VTTTTIHERRALRRTVLAFAAVAASTFAITTAVGQDTNPGTPADTVRDFLIDAVAEDDGFGACRYLTGHEMHAVRMLEPRGTSCEAALSTARLGSVDPESAIKHLAYHVEQRRDRARVTVAGHTFELRPATRRELTEFMAPPTPWRIDSGAAALVPPARLR
jgi:hypothetical protein